MDSPPPPPSPEVIAHNNRRIVCRRIATMLMQRGSIGYDPDPIAAAREAREQLDAMLADAAPRLQENT